MNSLEDELQELPVKAAPVTLDRRVAETLQAYEGRSCGVLSARIPIWACAAACLAFFAGGLLIRKAPMRPARVPAPLSPIVCSIEGGPAFAAVVAPEAAPDDFFLRKKRQINSQDTSGGT